MVDLKSIEKSLSEIRKKYGEASVFRGSDNIITKVDAISTGSLMLDSALGVGGVPRGRLVEISGPESGGHDIKIYR